MINRFKKIILRTRGFTLIETLVAVFILTTSIAAPLTIASRALTTALIAKDQITAFYLAQDAIEYVRFARDTNTLLGLNWLTGDGAADGSGPLLDATNLTNCISATGCFIDSTAQSYAQYPGYPTACGALCALPFSSTRKFFYLNNGVYNYSTAVAANRTGFWRQIILTQISASEYLVTVNVYWNDAGYVTRTVTIAENLFNWQ